MGSLSREMLQGIQRTLQGVERLEYKSGTDSEGEPANWIWVVLRADAPESVRSWENRQKIRSRVIDLLGDAGVTDWVYVRFRSADEKSLLDSISSTISST
jgi:hypothetical protein